jgi:hypothetical protein
MKTADINAFKGQIKDNILKWAEQQIDQMLPNKVAARAMLKNMAGNVLARFDHKIDQGVDALFLMFGDTKGNIDSDTVVDFVCDMLKEMPPTDYAIGSVGATVGKGEIRVQFPRNVFSDLIVGDLGGVKFTTADIQQIKNLFN